MLGRMDNLPRPLYSKLSWRLTGSLQQIFNLEALFPGHPLTADPHFNIWAADLDEAQGHSTLFDFSGSAAHLLRADATLEDLPSSQAFFLTRSEVGMKARRRFEQLGVTRIGEARSNQEAPTYAWDWWRTGCRDEVLDGTTLLIWGTRDMRAVRGVGQPPSVTGSPSFGTY